MQDDRKAVWSIPYVSVAFFPSFKKNFIAYRFSKVSSRPHCIFEIHQLWQSGFSRVYSNSCCSCSFEAEIIKIGLSSYKVYSNNILNFQERKTILNAYTEKSGKLLNTPRNLLAHWYYYCFYTVKWFQLLPSNIIQSDINHLFIHCRNIKQFYFTHRQGPYQVLSLWVRVDQGKIHTIRLFSIILRTLVVLPISRDAVGVFYSPSRQGIHKNCT